jgi:pimeloyl-ACP methyl ester carboxylesterase
MTKRTTYTPATSAKAVAYKSIPVEGVDIAYREAGDPADPKLVLLHGWPASSHQYRELIAALASRFHVIAPDYPGFGNSGAPDPSRFAYTFDKLAEVVEKFLEQKGFHRFGLYIQHYGGPEGGDYVVCLLMCRSRLTRCCEAYIESIASRMLAG